MRRIATGALILSATGMVVCRIFEDSVPILGWFRAIFEAATIGAMADWFAVVALFRHPLGLPIPHTAILPKNKAHVAESLANFIENSFLTEEQLGPKIREIDYATIIAGYLEQNADTLAGKATQLAPEILNTFSHEAMCALVESRAKELITNTEFAPLAGQGLEVLLQNGRDRQIFYSVIQSTRNLIEEHRPMIQSKIREEIPISADWLRGFPDLFAQLGAPLLEKFRDQLASAIASKTIEKVQAALDEAVEQPNSALWNSFDERLRKFVSDLKTSPEMAEKIRSMQQTLASSELVGDFANRAWSEIKEFLLRDCTADDSAVRRKISEALRAAARQLRENPGTRETLNPYISEQILAGAMKLRPQARELVISTIHAWDAEQMSARLEETVGADLQFIRLNGTIVGGLIGGAIYGLFWLFGL